MDHTNAYIHARAWKNNCKGAAQVSHVIWRARIGKKKCISDNSSNNNDDASIEANGISTRRTLIVRSHFRFPVKIRDWNWDIFGWFCLWRVVHLVDVGRINLVWWFLFGSDYEMLDYIFFSLSKRNPRSLSDFLPCKYFDFTSHFFPASTIISVKQISYTSAHITSATYLSCQFRFVKNFRLSTVEARMAIFISNRERRRK